MRIDKAIIGLGILILTTLTGFAQNTPGLVWATSTGGTDFQSNATSKSIALDKDSNIYVTGAFTGTIDLDPSIDDFKLSASGSRDIFIAKYNKQGDFIWGKGIGGLKPDEANAIHVDALGNVYVTGFFEATVDFDPSTGVNNLVSGYTANGVTLNYRSAFILKLENNGNYLWAGRMGFVPLWIDATATGMSIATDDGGSVIVVGTFSGEVDFDPSDAEETRIRSLGSSSGFVAKYDPSGTFSWAKSVGSISGASATDVAVSSSGDILVTGSYRDSTDFDPNSGVYKLAATVYNFNPTYDVYVWALNTNGDFIWAKSMGGNGNDYGSALSLDNQGNIYTVGGFNGDADFDPSPNAVVISSVQNSADIFVSKLNNEGDFVWARTVGGANTDFGYDIAVDSKQQVYSMGYFMESVDFDPGSNQALLTSTFKSVFVSKLDGDGNYLNAYQIDNSGAFTTKSGGIAADNSGNVVVSQDLFDVTDLDPTVCVFNQAPIIGTSGFFLQKVNPSVKPSCISDATITKQPKDTAVCVGSLAIFSIIATGTNLKYQWQKLNSSTRSYDDLISTTKISGTTSPILKISNVDVFDGGTYHCKVSSSSDSFSDNAILTVSTLPAAPKILTPNPEACTNTLLLEVSDKDNYKWTLANSVLPDTLKILSQISYETNTGFATRTTVSNYKEGNSKLYLKTTSTVGCSRLDSTTLSYYPKEKPVLSNNPIIGDSIRLIAQPIARGNISYNGTWLVVKGSAVIKNSTLASPVASKLSLGQNVFVYTLNNPCKTNDTLKINYSQSQLPTVYAGKDSITFDSTITLKATPTPLQGGYRGYWHIAGKKANGVIVSDTTKATTSAKLLIGDNIFIWTVTNGEFFKTDSVKYTRNRSNVPVIPIVFSGRDSTSCDSVITLKATPVTQAGYRSYWRIAGKKANGIIIIDTTKAVTSAKLAFGANAFVWTVTNGQISSFDTVIYTRSGLPNKPTIATVSSEACSTSQVLQITISANDASNKYKWTRIGAQGTDTLRIASTQIQQGTQGTSIISTTISNYKTGTNTLLLTTTNASKCVRTDQTTLAYFPNEIPVLSNNTIVGDSIRLTAQSVVRGNVTYQGTWSTKGSAIIKNPISVSTVANKLSIGANKFTYTLNNFCKTRDSLSVTYLPSGSVNAGKDTSTCSDSIVLAATPAPLGFSGVWRSTNKSLIFKDSTLATTKVSSLANGVNTLTWNIKSGVTIDGSATLKITKNAKPIPQIETFMSVCKADTNLSARLNSGETGTWRNIGTNATRIVTATTPNTRVIGLGRFKPESTRTLNLFEWTVSNGACAAKDTLSVFLADSIKILTDTISGIAGELIQVKVYKDYITSFTGIFQGLKVVGILDKSIIDTSYTQGDTSVFFQTSRKLLTKKYSTNYSLVNSCGIASKQSTLTIASRNVAPNSKPIKQTINQDSNPHIITISGYELDSNKYITKVKILAQPSSGANLRFEVSPDSSSISFYIDYTTVKDFKGEDRFSFRLYDQEDSTTREAVLDRDIDLGLKIYNAVSPNGDGKHDVFEIEGIEQEIYKNNKVEIFNRWGDRVYKESGYNNKEVAFDGGTLPDGTYYYVLDLGNDRKILKGFLLLSR